MQAEWSFDPVFPVFPLTSEERLAGFMVTVLARSDPKRPGQKRYVWAVAVRNELGAIAVRMQAPGNGIEYLVVPGMESFGAPAEAARRVMGR